MTGPIRGTRLPVEGKRFIVRAVVDAKVNGMPIGKSCAILMIDPRRVRRWIRGRDPQALTETDLTDGPPIAKVARTPSPRMSAPRSSRRPGTKSSPICAIAS